MSESHFLESYKIKIKIKLFRVLEVEDVCFFKHEGEAFTGDMLFMGKPFKICFGKSVSAVQKTT